MKDLTNPVINMKHVAEQAQVSVATVSNVINETGRVSKNTILRVKSVIEDLGYTPSMAARHLKTNQSQLIGVVVPTINDGKLQDNPFYWSLVAGIEEGVRDTKFQVMLVGVDENESQFSFVMERKMDGLIIVGANEGSNLMKAFVDIQVPCVFMDSYLSSTKVNQIGIDDRIGAYQATKHLIDLGHTSIAVLTGEVPYEKINRYGVLHERIQGYQMALAEHGIPFKEDLLLNDHTNLEGGRQAAKKVTRLDVTAVFSFSDVAAMGLLKGLDEQGLHVPDDLSVIGFDDLFMSAYTKPPLTTVKQDIVAKGQTAVMQILEKIESKRDVPYRKVVLPTELVIRQSTAKPRGLTNKE